jgi:hypothetical protein
MRKTKWKKSLESLTRGCADNIKINFQETGRETVSCSLLIAETN